MSALTTVADLCAVDERTIIEDANGVELTMECSGRPTTNVNWITWVRADGVNVHSDQVALPATVTGIAPERSHVGHLVVALASHVWFCRTCRMRFDGEPATEAVAA